MGLENRWLASIRKWYPSGSWGRFAVFAVGVLLLGFVLPDSLRLPGPPAPTTTTATTTDTTPPAPTFDFTVDELLGRWNRVAPDIPFESFEDLGNGRHVAELFPGGPVIVAQVDAASNKVDYVEAIIALDAQLTLLEAHAMSEILIAAMADLPVFDPDEPALLDLFNDLAEGPASTTSRIGVGLVTLRLTPDPVLIMEVAP